MLLTPEQQELLHKYSKWLEENGYLDGDWWAEEPNAVDRFMNDKQND